MIIYGYKAINIILKAKCEKCDNGFLEEVKPNKYKPNEGLLYKCNICGYEEYIEDSFPKSISVEDPNEKNYVF